MCKATTETMQAGTPDESALGWSLPRAFLCVAELDAIARSCQLLALWD